MCGIAGYMDFERKDSHMFRALTLMNNEQLHRGPDGQGFVTFNENTASPFYFQKSNFEFQGEKLSYYPSIPYTDENVKDWMGFAHQRLAIIDTGSTGHQPMSDSSDKYWITYNGEVYNYLEIKAELSNLGHQFRTQSDTEVVLHAYMQWGEDCLQKFNGMFSFVVCDLNKKCWFGARDRTGVKPFYYYKDNAKFLFASEIKTLMASSLIKPELNYTAVADFFLFNKVEFEAESMMKGVMELPPGHCFTLSLSNGDFKLSRYFKYDSDIQGSNKEFTINEIKEKVIDSIRLRLRSDVPVGSCLSGGLDSSCIVSVASDLLKLQGKGQIDVFTSSFSNPEMDESKWAEKVVNFSNSKWHRTWPDVQGLKNDLEDLIYSQDIPIRSTSTYAQYSVMKLIHQNGIKVVLDGQGGDELFAGYHQHQYIQQLSSLKHLKIKEFVDQLRYFGFVKGSKIFTHSFLKYTLSQKLPVKLKQNMWLKYFQESELLNSEFVNKHIKRVSKVPVSPSGNLNDFLLHEYYNGPLKELLKCEDRASMRFSVESRTPFADDVNLAQLLFSIPSNQKIQKGYSKYLLRESLKTLVPEEILKRKDKMGYVTPNNAWICELKDHFRPYFDSLPKEIFNLQKIDSRFDKFFSPENSQENYRVFKFISFAIWYKVFFTKWKKSF